MYYIYDISRTQRPAAHFFAGPEGRPKDLKWLLSQILSQPETRLPKGMVAS